MSRKNPNAELPLGIALVFVMNMTTAFIVLPWLIGLLTSFLSSLTELSQDQRANLPLIPVAFILGIGLTQLLYVIPLGIYFHRLGRSNMVKGLMIGAIITALLNGGCFIFFWVNT
jgi:hypothetical protein